MNPLTLYVLTLIEVPLKGSKEEICGTAAKRKPLLLLGGIPLCTPVACDRLEKVEKVW